MELIPTSSPFPSLLEHDLHDAAVKRCRCHDELMQGNPGSGWRCAVRRREWYRNYYAANREKERERNLRRIRVRAGGVQWYVGRTPTVESAQALRAWIQREIPR